MEKVTEIPLPDLCGTSKDIMERTDTPNVASAVKDPLVEHPDDRLEHDVAKDCEGICTDADGTILYNKSRTESSFDEITSDKGSRTQNNSAEEVELSDFELDGLGGRQREYDIIVLPSL